jgi:hypothetical protein
LGTKRSRQGRQTGSSGRLNRTYLIVGLIAAAFLAGFAALVVFDARQQAASRPPGEVEDIDVGSARQHTEGDVDYEQTPPAGGEHNPVWQNAGFYPEPIRDENAVHTLEHGAVWITYRPDLPQGQVEQLRDIAQSQSCVLVSPYPELGAPIVASAWGKQMSLESADDPDLERFVRAYLQGEQTPEPGAACTGGVGEPS